MPFSHPIKACLSFVDCTPWVLSRSTTLFDLRQITTILVEDKTRSLISNQNAFRISTVTKISSRVQEDAAILNLNPCPE